jgi:uncharacterized Zn finger protein
MSTTNNMEGISCPKCGLINKENIKIYNRNLRKQSFKMAPILPTCLICGSEVSVSKNNMDENNNKVIILTGPVPVENLLQLKCLWKSMVFM